MASVSVGEQSAALPETLPNLQEGRPSSKNDGVAEGIPSPGRLHLSPEEDVERGVLQQVENEVTMEGEWRKRALRLAGRLQGSQWDPLPGADLEFSDFMDLLKQGRVQFMEYGDYGQHVAAILPHAAAELAEGAPPAGVVSQTDATGGGPGAKANSLQDQEVAWLRHKVRRMPADAHNAIWGQLRGQVADVRVVNHQASVAAQVVPTLALAAAWVVRVLVAVALYRAVDHLLFPFYKPTKLEDRPRSAPQRMTAALDPGLGTMGQSRARFISAEERTGVTFEDFAGQEYIKRELQEVVRILREAREFEDLGVYCPKGVMLFGPPGTGKTLLARAIAGEAGVPFFSVSGAEFVEMFAGVAASRVKDLFFRARQFAPSIIFIDEIDAIGTKRGSAGSLDGGSIEREQGLIQILTELDGFQESAAKVLVIGATNRLDMLDPALLRKGRFDKVLRVGLPTEEGRYAILQVHARNKHFRSLEERDALLRELATMTEDFSGAELMNVLNEAAILAVRGDQDEIEREQLMQALDRQAGEFKTGEEDVVEAPEVRLRTAYREAAIAVMALALPDPSRPILKTTLEDCDPLPNIEYVKVRHRTFSRHPDMINAIVRAFTIPVMERLIFGPDNVSWQAGVAYRQAVQLADYVILRSGMSALGKVTYETQKDLMHHLVPKVVALRDEYLRYGQQKCEAVLGDYRSALDTIAERLLETGSITGTELQEIFEATPRLGLGPDKVRAIDEYGALMRAGRWGVHGLSLPGRATFSPGNSGYATFGAPRPRQVRRVSESTWEKIDEMWRERLRELEALDREDEEAEGKAPVYLLEPEFL